MPALSDLIVVNITATTAGVTQAGFGVPLILGTPSWSVDRTRTYTDISGVAADFAATRPEYKAAAAIFSQQPRPQSIRIGRLANKPTQAYTITPTAVNSTSYTMTVDGQTVTYASDSTATAAEIVTGLTSLINALAAPAPTLTASGTSTLILTGNSAGSWDSVSVADPTLLSLVENHADPGVGTDLDAILNADQTWYTIINPWNSTAMVGGIASWAESNKKTFICALQEGTSATVAQSSGTDEMKALQTAAYKRTMAIYHPDCGAFADAAWAGRILPLTPGSETAAYKTLAGVAAVTMTETQRTNVLARNGNTYQTFAGINITFPGKVASGEYWDVTRLIDWTTARIQEAVFGGLAANDKVPYTDEGIAFVAGKVRGVLQEGVRNGGYVSFTVQAPRAADVPSADRASRTLNNVLFTATLAGAIHTATISGTVSF